MITDIIRGDKIHDDSYSFVTVNINLRVTDIYIRIKPLLFSYFLHRTLVILFHTKLENEIKFPLVLKTMNRES